MIILLSVCKATVGLQRTRNENIHFLHATVRGTVLFPFFWSEVCVIQKKGTFCNPGMCKYFRANIVKKRLCNTQK